MYDLKLDASGDLEISDTGDVMLTQSVKQAVEIRQELQEEHGGQETGVRVVFEREAEEFSE